VRRRNSNSDAGHLFSLMCLGQNSSRQIWPREITHIKNYTHLFITFGIKRSRSHIAGRAAAAAWHTTRSVFACGDERHSIIDLAHTPTAVRKCNIISVGHVRPVARAQKFAQAPSVNYHRAASEKTPAVNDSMLRCRSTDEISSDKALKKRTKDIRKLSTHP
jgi:hypothetical protein